MLLCLGSTLRSLEDYVRCLFACLFVCLFGWFAGGLVAWWLIIFDTFIASFCSSAHDILERTEDLLLRSCSNCGRLRARCEVD